MPDDRKGVTVSELIEQLQRLPPDYVVVLPKHLDSMRCAALKSVKVGYSDPYIRTQPYYDCSWGAEDDWDGCRQEFWLNFNEPDPGEQYPGDNAVLLEPW